MITLKGNLLPIDPEKIAADFSKSLKALKKTILIALIIKDLLYSSEIFKNGTYGI